MTTTFEDVKSKKSEPSAEESAARAPVRLAREQGLALTGPDGLLKLFTKNVLEAALNEELTEHLELVLLLLANTGRFYREAVDEQRKWLNQAVFARIAIDFTDDDGPHPTQETLSVDMAGELTEPVAAVTGLAQLGTNGRKARDRSRERARGRGPGRAERNPGAACACRGFQPD